MSSIPKRSATQAFVRHDYVYLFYGLAILQIFVSSSLGPLMPFLRSELNINYTVASFHFSALAIGMMIGGSFADRAVKRLGRKFGTWVGMAGCAAAVACLTLGHNVAVTIFGAALIGLSYAFTGLCRDATFSEKLGEHRTTAIMEVNVVACAAAGLVPIAIGQFARFGAGWRMPMFIVVALMAVSWFLGNKVDVSANHESETKAASGKLTITHWMYWSVILLAAAIEWSFAYWAPDYFEKVTHLTRADACSAVGAWFAAMLVGRAMGAALSKRLPLHVLLPATTLFALGGFCIFWIGGTALSSISGLFVAGLGVANMYPLTLSAALGLDTNLSALMASREKVACGASSLVGPLAVGCVADHAGISQAYGLVGALLVVALLVIAIANRSAKRYAVARALATAPIAATNETTRDSLPLLSAKGER